MIISCEKALIPADSLIDVRLDLGFDTIDWHTVWSSAIMDNARARTLATNSLFSAVLLSAFGWGLFHAWAIGIGARGFIHALIALPGLALSGLVLYRYALHWPAPVAKHNGTPQGARRFTNPNSITCYILLPATGVAIALLVNHGSLFALAIATILLSIVPWAKLAFCRDYFFPSLAMIGAGGVLGLGFSEQPFHPLHYPLCAWMFFMASILTVLFVILTHRNQTDRMPSSGY